MKGFRIVLLCGALLGNRCVYAQDERTLPTGESRISPDGRFVVRLVATPLLRESGQQLTQNLSIEDKSGGKSSLVSVLNPVFLIAWTKDSRSIVAVGHLAGGSQAWAYHFDGVGWSQHIIDPLNEDQVGHCAVVKLKMGAEDFDVTYKVSDESLGRRHPQYYACTLHVSGATGAIIHSGSRHKMSADTYIRTELHIQ